MAEEGYGVANQMTGEFANSVLRNAVDGVPAQFIDAELSVYAPLGETCACQLVPRFEDSCDEPQLQAHISCDSSRFLAHEARRLATLPHVRTSCQAPLLFLEPS